MKVGMFKNFISVTRKIMLLIIFIFNALSVHAQQRKIDSLKNLISNTKKDTAKIDLYEKLGDAYRNEKKLDSSILSYQKALELNEKYNYSIQQQCWDIGTIDFILYEMGNYSESLKYASQELALSEQLNDTFQKGFSHLVFGHDFRELDEYRQSLNHYFKAKEFFKIYWLSRNKPEDNTYTLLCISETYLKMNRLDSALIYVRQAYKIAVANADGGSILLSTRIFGDIYFAKGDDETAFNYYRQYIPDYVKYKGNNRDMGFVFNNMAKIFQKRNQNDSAIFYAKKALTNAKEHHDQENIYNAATALSDLYAKQDEYKKMADQKNNSNSTSASGNKIDRTEIDYLKKLISNTKADTAKIILLEQLGQAYRDEKKLDSSILTYKQALELNKKINYSLLGQRWELACIDYMFYVTGNYAQSLVYALQELELTEKMNDKFHLGYVHLVFGHDYKGLGEYRKSLEHYFKAKQFFTIYKQPNSDSQINTYTNLCISEVYLKISHPDSALLFTQQAYRSALADSIHTMQQGNSAVTNYILYSIRTFGDIYQAKGDYQTALNYYRQYITGFIKYKENNRDLGFVFNNMSKIFQKRGETDSAIFYAKKALSNAKEYHDEQNIYDAATALYNFYKDNDDYKTVPDMKGNFDNIDKLNKNRNRYNNNVDRFKIDSLKNELALAKTDSAKLEIIRQIGQQYRDAAKLDSSIQIYQQALEFVQKSKLPIIYEIWQLTTLGYLNMITGNYSEAMKYSTRGLQLSEQTNNNGQMAASLNNIADDYAGMGDLRRALEYYFKAKKVYERYESGHMAIQDIAETYLKMHMLDSALYYNKIAYHIADTGHNQQYMIDFAVRVFASIYAEKGEDELALKYYRQFVTDFYKYNLNNREIDRVYLGIAKLYQKKNEIDSSIFYAEKALAAAKIYNDEEHIFNTSELLYNLHDSLHNESEAFRYFKIAAAAKDSMASIEKIRQIQNLAYQEQVREKEKEEADAKEAARTRLIITIAAIVVLILSFLLWNRIRQLRLKHKMILEQKESEKLKAIDRMKEKFFSNITHELRTPLSLIMSPAEFYLEHPEELNDTNKFLKSIYKNSGYLLNLINQLLDISKLDAGKMSIALSKGEFGNYIDDLVKTFKDEAIKKQIALHFENDLTGAYLFDEEHWKKIINNLLGNALKFTPANGNIFVSVNKISGATESATIQLVVEDTGIGIDEDQVPFITDRFYQADNKLSRKYEGAGIGLSLVNELVRLMDGKLEIKSEKGKGSVLTITATLLSAKGKEGYPEIIPIVKVSQLSDINTGVIATPTERGKNVPLILVTEDNKELRDFLKDSIEPLYKVITASDGKEGFEMALTQIPDMIISDVMMPVMDGFEFCDKIKSTHATSHIPFIILSAKTTYESRIEGLQKGADDYFTKPFSVDELRTKIKNILSRQEQLRKHYFEQLTSAKPLPAFTDVQDEFLKATYRIIEENIDNSQLSLEFLAGKMALKEDVLNRKFSSVIGLSANELIRQFRIKKTEMEHQMLELEANALRAQMNPHFIFNCMNSIKSLIQQKEEDKAINYLTTFSKLIRTIFQNSDKREINLFEELETCKLYTQLESMRFGKKFNYHFNIDETIDLKSMQVPALIVQPFIENAIWHGIMPKEEGGTLTVAISKKEDTISCIIDDDGIGREMSKQNKFKGESSAHQSKGVHLTQSRLDLDNILNQRNGSVEIIDKKDAEGKPAGTKIVLTFIEF